LNLPVDFLSAFLFPIRILLFEKNKIMSSFIDFGLAFKNKIIELKEGDTQLTLKELALVRLVKKKFFQDLEGLYETGRNVEALSETLRIARAKAR